MLRIGAIPGANKELARLEDLRGKVDFGFQATNTTGSEPTRICNLVLQGGGVLGLAHVGFICGMEKAGYRFAGVAGTSAGAIVATGIVCVRSGRVEAEVGEELLRIVDSMPMSDFVDGPSDLRALINHVAAGGKLFSLRNLPAIVHAAFRVIWKRGLNPGVAFEEWLQGTFARYGVRSNRQLVDILSDTHQRLIALGISRPKTPQQVIKENEDLQRELGDTKMFPADASILDDERAEQKVPPETTDVEALAPKFRTEEVDWLRVIASAMPSGVKFYFPRDLKNLDSSYMARSPAVFVRASMSIPAFFEPRYLRSHPINWSKRVDAQLNRLASEGQRKDFKSTNPIAFVDGGLFSNLALDAFDGIQGVPTVALTLVDWADSRRYQYQSTLPGLFRDIYGLFDAVRLQRDRDAWDQQQGNSDVQLVEVDTSGLNWLNFNLSDEEKADLFLRGLKRARSFLESLRRTP